MPLPETGPVARAGFLDWLLTEGRGLSDAAELLAAFSHRLRDTGVPLWRTAWWVPALHPVVRGIFSTWDPDNGYSERIRHHGSELTDVYLSSPFAAILEHGLDEVRYHPAMAQPGHAHHPLFDELAAEGATDYLALPIRVSGSRLSCGSFTTRHPDGFRDDDIALIKALVAPLGCILSVHFYHRLAATLLDVYVGHQSGARILSGEIRRGSGQTLRAVLWFCDMRGFTELSDRLPQTELIALLNGYFDIMGGAVEARGGEILKFMGDALLAIFPLPAPDAADARPDEAAAHAGSHTEAAVARNAFEAAASALQGMAALNRERKAWGQPVLRAGIALHVGQVMYGNIGTAGRLDFTVIGPAVNLTSRIEKLCKDLGRPLLTSHSFAALCPGRLVSLGHHAVRGLATPIEIFGLPDCCDPDVPATVETPAGGATGPRTASPAPRAPMPANQPHSPVLEDWSRWTNKEAV